MAITEKGKITTTQLSGSLIALLGLTGSVGRFTNASTGTTGYFYTVGGGAGVDAGVTLGGARYNNAASLNGFNDNLNISLPVGPGPVGGAWSRHNDLDGNRVGNSFGVSGGLPAGISGTMTQTGLFGCRLGGR